jgi:hypothetical protein
MAPKRRLSMGMHLEDLVNPRNLIKEEVDMHNYPLKLRNQKGPKNAPKRRSISITRVVAVATFPAHPGVTGMIVQ